MSGKPTEDRQQKEDPETTSTWESEKETAQQHEDKERTKEWEKGKG